MRLSHSLSSCFLLLVLFNSVGMGGAVTTSSGLQSGNAGVVPLESSGLVFNVAEFAFTGHSLTDRVDSLSLTFTLSDGDTGVGDMDFNSLEITLDGVRTGIFANGFLNKSIRQVTFTRSLSSSLGQLLTAKFADGTATVGLIDHTANSVDRIYNGNFISAIKKNKLPNSYTLTPVYSQFSFSQVPEPSTFAAIAGIATLGALARLRRRRVGS